MSFIKYIYDTVFGKKEPKKPKRKTPKAIAFQRLVQVKDLPDFMQGHKNLKGVYIGGCISNPVSEWVDSRDGTAHAHNHGNDAGYICCKSERQFLKKTTMQHEISHIATKQNHTIAWAEYYASLDVPKWLTVNWLQKKYKFKGKKQNATGKLASE